MKAVRYILPLLILVFLSSALCAQQIVNFEYDLAGNRVLRYLDTKKSTEAEVDSLFKAGTITDKITGDNLIRVYPNPTYGIINVEFMEIIEGQTVYFITDQNGRQVMTGKTNSLSNTIDITHQSRGVYYLVIKAPEIYQVYKIIKQ
ncbi:MAG TPA: hypothetical protein DCL86_13125 [Bacteroidales bacterium]|nr:hypothetical protein [Bacteroidales bacterium]